MRTLAADFGIVLPSKKPGTYLVPCPACKPLAGATDRVRRLRAEAKCLQVTITDESDPNGADSRWYCAFCGTMGNLTYGTMTEPDAEAMRRWRAGEPPSITPAEWDPNALGRLLRRGISQAAIDRCRVTFELGVWVQAAEEVYNAIALPYYQAGKLVAVKHIVGRGLSQIHGTPSLFGIDDVIYTNDDGSVVPQEIAYIVPDEMSKLAMETAGFPNTIALPWLPAKKEFGDYFSILDRANYKLVDKDDDAELGLIDRIETFYLAMDSTPAGVKLEDELVRRLGPERCVRVRWPKLPFPGEAKTLWDGKTIVQPGDTFKDANETLYCAGIAAIQQAMRDARPIPIDGVFRVEDFEADIWDYYFNGLPPGFALPRGKDGIGNAFVNKDGENCLAFQTRTTCVWTGIPGHGKSRAMENTTVELSRSEDFKWVYFSPEVNPLQLFATYLMSQWAGVPFNKGYVDRMNEQLTKAAIKWLHEHFFFLKAGLLPFSVQDLLDRATKLVRRYGVNGMVIDPWNNVYHSRKAFEREDEYIGQALQKINAWREQNNVLVHIVAHPGKFKMVDGKEPKVNLNDIKGGSEFFSMTDFGFSVWRDRGDENSNSEIHIQKSKFQHLATMGVAQLKFDKPTSKFYDAGVPFGGVPTKQRNRGEQPLFEAPEYGTEDGAPPWLQGHEYDL